MDKNSQIGLLFLINCVACIFAGVIFWDSLTIVQVCRLPNSLPWALFDQQARCQPLLYYYSNQVQDLLYFQESSLKIRLFQEHCVHRAQHGCSIAQFDAGVRVRYTKNKVNKKKGLWTWGRGILSVQDFLCDLAMKPNKVFHRIFSADIILFSICKLQKFQIFVTNFNFKRQEAIQGRKLYEEIRCASIGNTFFTISEHHQPFPNQEKSQLELGHVFEKYFFSKAFVKKSWSPSPILLKEKKIWKDLTNFQH